MTICPRCGGPLRIIPGGHVCDACAWGWMPLADRDSLPAGTEDVDEQRVGAHGIRYGCGEVRPAFDRDNPPWGRGLTI